ncbi:MAG TPA: UPF0149 family protein [Xanthomonadaceae bacterium]|nr:UPF0149 family protein [Xanthomonadaceae bacterium]
MSPDPLPALGEVQLEADTLQLGVDAAELHGGLCGLLAAGAEPGRRDWLQRLALEPAGAAPQMPGTALDRMFLATLGQIDDPELRFGLLLPDEDAALDSRAEALLAWCRGFLGGFGLAAGAQPPLSPEAAEALEDLGRIAVTDPGLDGTEADEVALSEITEFIRVAALLLHSDCAPAPRPGVLH